MIKHDCGRDRVDILDDDMKTRTGLWLYLYIQKQCFIMQVLKTRQDEIVEQIKQYEDKLAEFNLNSIQFDENAQLRIDKDKLINEAELLKLKMAQVNSILRQVETENQALKQQKAVNDAQI